MLDADAAFAAKLQAEEYGHTPSSDLRVGDSGGSASQKKSKRLGLGEEGKQVKRLFSGGFEECSSN
jgi:hypothetical protein